MSKDKVSKTDKEEPQPQYMLNVQEIIDNVIRRGSLPVGTKITTVNNVKDNVSKEIHDQAVDNFMEAIGEYLNSNDTHEVDVVVTCHTDTQTEVARFSITQGEPMDGIIPISITDQTTTLTPIDEESHDRVKFTLSEKLDDIMQYTLWTLGND